MYGMNAIARRKCKARKKDGTPCEAWAVWDDPRQVCVAHAGRHHTGRRLLFFSPHQKANYLPCECVAYNWPHRPGGGLCEWPGEPEYRLTTPAGTHTYPRVRRPKWLRW